MTATSAPFGLKPLRHISGQAKAVRGTIASGASAMYKHQPVKYAADGSVAPAAAGDAFLGSFEGCEFTSGGKRFVQNFWPGGTVASDAIAYFYADPGVVYAIQADGTVDQADIGSHGDFTNITNGNATTGVSAATITATPVTSGTAQLQVLDIVQTEDNAWGDAYTVVEVMIAEHQLGGTKSTAF